MLRRTLAGLVAAAVLAAPGFAQTVDEIVAKNIEAHGGLARLKAVSSMRMSGKITLGPGIEAPLVIEMKRPLSARMEMTFQGNLGVQAFDGRNGWSISPMSATKNPEPMSSDDRKEIEEQADMDGPLVDWKEKGHQVELLGKEKMEGSDVYKLKVTLKTGDLRYFFLDADSCLEIKAESKRTVRGTEAEVETIIGDYKEVDGLVLPHSIESGAKGSPEKQNITIEKIELNPPLDDARFKMPEVKKP